MKHNKIIYLTAFLLSLSLILLLEASSLKLLTEDIKPIEKEKIEIELLLSASDELLGEETQTDKTKNVKNQNKLIVNQEQNKKADKNSSAVEEEITEEKEQLVEDKIIEKKETPKKEIKKVKNKPVKPKQQENNEIIEETELEKKTVKREKVEVENKPPAWMQDSKNKSLQDNSEEQKVDKKSDKFDLDSFIANLEAEEKLEKNSQKTKKAAETSVSQTDNSSTFNEIDNKSQEENKVYDLRKGSPDSIKKPEIKEYSKPSYPSNLRKRNIEGQVIVTLRIDKEGEIHDLKINKSSGYQSFDQAALKAVSNWKFKAAEKDNKKVEIIVNLPIKFKLN